MRQQFERWRRQVQSLRASLGTGKPRLAALEIEPLPLLLR